MHLPPSNPPRSSSIDAAFSPFLSSSSSSSFLLFLLSFKKSRQTFKTFSHAFTRSSLETLKGSWLYVTLSEVILPNHGAVLRDRDASEMLANVTVSNASSEFSIAYIVHSHSSKRGQARRPTRNRISRISSPSSPIETAKLFSK